MSKLSVGDKVQVNSRGDSKDGEVGFIEEIDAATYFSYRLRFDDEHDYPCKEDELVKVEEEEDDDFELGDRVRVSVESSDFYQQESEIVEMEGSGCCLELHSCISDEINRYWFNKNELELVDMAKFEKGDTVRVKEDAFDYRNPAKNVSKMKSLQGVTGEIKGEAKIYENCFMVDFNVSNTWIWHQAQLEKITETDMANNFDEFYVEVDGPNHSQFLQEIAFEEGYGWPSKGQEIFAKNRPYLIFNSRSRGSITHSGGLVISSIENKLEDFTIDEFRQALRGEYFEDEPDPIVIGGYEVEFLDSYSKIGCIEYRNFQLKNLYDRLCAVKSRCKGNLNISLNHPDVGEIPFEKIKAIYERISD